MFIGLYIDSANVALILCKIKGFMKMKERGKIIILAIVRKKVI